MSLRDLIFGNPWVYDRLRPMLVGGHDFTRIYARLEAGPDDVVLDVGCGTGQALEYLPPVREYHGFDTDQSALARLRLRHPRPEVKLYDHRLTAEDLRRIRPGRICLMGLLHHLSDAEAGDLLALLKAQTGPARLLTMDPVFVSGLWLNNLLAGLDRGRYVRDEAGLRKLLAAAKLEPAWTGWHDFLGGRVKLFLTQTELRG